MSVIGRVDLPTDVLGGMVTNIRPTALPSGGSPANLNVEFIPGGGVMSRAGFQRVAGPIAGTPSIVWIDDYTDGLGVTHLIALDANGNFYVDLVEAGSTLTGVGATGYGCTAFLRKYIAINDGKNGLGMPRQWDGTNFDRVSDEGPGTENALYYALNGQPTKVFQSGLEVTDIAPVALVVTAAVRLGGVVTITYTPTVTAGTNYAPFFIGQSVAVAGMTASSFNQNPAIIIGVPTPNQIQYAQNAADATATGFGTATINPGGTAGVYQITALFQTRTGGISPAGNAVTWETAGAKLARVGFACHVPAYVQNIIFAFTAVNADSFFYLPQWVFPASLLALNDYVFVIDVVDSITLSSNLNVDGSLTQTVLPEAAFCLQYNQRLVWGGLRNNLTNWDNLGFDGGNGYSVNGTLPNSWMYASNTYPTFQTTSLTTGNDPLAAFWGGCLCLLLGNQSTGNTFYQSAVFDDFGQPRIEAGVGYSARFRVRLTGILPNLTAGTLTIDLVSATGGFSTGGITLNYTQVNETWTEFIAPITPAGGLATIPADLMLEIKATGLAGANNFVGFLVDQGSIFPTLNPYLNDSALVSAVALPETYNQSPIGPVSLVNVNAGDGQTLRGGFELLGNLYLIKDGRIFVSRDNGGDPSTWEWDQVAAVGIPSPNCVAGGKLENMNGDDEEFSILANRNGVYLFDSTVPQPIIRELQPNGGSYVPFFDYAVTSKDQANLEGQMWVKIDARKRRVYVGISTVSAAAFADTICMMDYSSVAFASEIGAYPQIHDSPYTGKELALDKARKWTIWNSPGLGHFAAAHIFQAPEPENLSVYGSPYPPSLLVSSGDDNGLIYYLSDNISNFTVAHDDDGTPFPFMWQGCFWPTSEQRGLVEQLAQNRGNMFQMCYLTMTIEGAGLIAPQIVDAAGNVLQQCPNYALSSPAPKDYECKINTISERQSIIISQNALGSWVLIESITPWMDIAKWSPVRGA